MVWQTKLLNISLRCLCWCWYTAKLSNMRNRFDRLGTSCWTLLQALNRMRLWQRTPDSTENVLKLRITLHSEFCSNSVFHAMLHLLPCINDDLHDLQNLYISLMYPWCSNVLPLLISYVADWVQNCLLPIFQSKGLARLDTEGCS